MIVLSQEIKSVMRVESIEGVHLAYEPLIVHTNGVLLSIFDVDLTGNLSQGF